MNEKPTPIPGYTTQVVLSNRRFSEEFKHDAVRLILRTVIICGFHDKAISYQPSVFSYRLLIARRRALGDADVAREIRTVRRRKQQAS